MLRAILAASIFFLASQCFAVTVQFSCTFVNHIITKPDDPYPNPNLCANQVTVNPDNAKTTTDDKYWSGAGANGCTYLVSAKKLTTGGYSWFVAIVDKNGKCVVQAGANAVGNTTASGTVYSSTQRGIAMMAASNGTFVVGP